MLRYWRFALAFAGGVAATLAVQFLLAKGAPKQDARAPRKVDLSVEDGGIYRVRSVVDGDTIVLENGVHIRYQGINAPETGRFVKDAAPFGKEATARNRELVEGRRVQLALARQPLDAYGRILSRISALPEEGGSGEPIDVETVLLEEGLACYFGLGLPPEEREKFQALESAAREKKAGLWGLPQSPRDAEARALPFCAATKSEVFHRSECAQAKRISPAHFQGYRSLEEVLATGRKPCSQCIKKELGEAHRTSPVADEKAEVR